MRIIPLIISVAATTGLIIGLNTQLKVGASKTPRLGYFLSPQQGFWQNAEATDAGYEQQLNIPGILNKADVYLDDRLVPHIYAANNDDAYFIQGFLHAKFRLWQMDFQSYVAAGRLSEVIGSDGLKTDKYFRRLGMLYGAERSLNALELDPDTKSIADAYTRGVNAYINSLKDNEIPFEYKLLDYKPEHWTNLKTALFLKLMSFDLTGQGDADLSMNNTRDYLGYETFKKLFPERPDSLDPIIPRGTAFGKPSMVAKVPATADSAYFHKSGKGITAAPPIIPDKNNGSNNWAVSGSKTKSGKPILCNDPHLGLNLPSLWYEMQISTPSQNTYGASFPGAPSIIIGFNDKIAWGVTNAGRDVKDFYDITFKDTSMQEYLLNNTWVKSTFRYEQIKVKGEPDDLETIAMTVFGPVMYDQHYKSSNEDGRNIAVRWTAHDSSNELLTFVKLNRARSFSDYIDAISSYQCPGQNFVFASVSGDIAIRQQGKFVNHWKHQGDFIQPGNDSAYLWQGFIPANENPQIINPARGFVSSANQMVTDSTYPYYLGRSGNFPVYRGLIINRKLAQMNQITPEDMQTMQTDTYNVLAEITRPKLLQYLDEKQLTITEKNYLDTLKDWNLRNDIHEKGATIYKTFWDSLYKQTYGDEYRNAKFRLYWPEQVTLAEALIKDSAYAFADDISTPAIKETWKDIVLIAFQKACKTLVKESQTNQLEWGVHKDTYIGHLLKIPALGRLHLPIGGGAEEINATTENHGPSWRMIVHMTIPIEAYAVYPGGQNGNPGSPYYDSFVDHWVNGKYYSILFLDKETASHHKRILWHLTFNKA